MEFSTHKEIDGLSPGVGFMLGVLHRTGNAYWSAGYCVVTRERVTLVVLSLMT